MTITTATLVDLAPEESYVLAYGERPDRCALSDVRRLPRLKSR